MKSNNGDNDGDNDGDNNKDINIIPTINKLMPQFETIETIESLIQKMRDELILDNCSFIWSGIENNIFKKGISQKLDELQNEIDTDRNFVNKLIEQLTKIGDNKIKGQISMSDNATNGIHLHTTTARKDILEIYFSKADNCIHVGKQKITNKDIKFLKMKESKWQIDVPYLKISSGTLKANLENLFKLVKEEFYVWCQKIIVSKSPILDALNKLAIFISEIDVLQSNSMIAVENCYVMPQIILKDNSYIDDGISSTTHCPYLF
jgi:DNA mismatch repair ATPase MutS